MVFLSLDPCTDKPCGRQTQTSIKEVLMDGVAIALLRFGRVDRVVRLVIRQRRVELSIFSASVPGNAVTIFGLLFATGCAEY